MSKNLEKVILYYNLSMEELKKFSIEQLKNNEPVGLGVM